MDFVTFSPWVESGERPLSRNDSFIWLPEQQPRFLGIATLMLYVPIELGVLHQAGGVTVLTTLLYVLHSLRLPVALAAVL